MKQERYIDHAGCHRVGISGRCGLECEVYLSGGCPDPEEMSEQIETEDELEEHIELYEIQ